MKSALSFVIPCLNEEITLPAVLRVIQDTIKRHFYDRETEIIVADNGSSDSSIDIARTFGARVVPCTQKGYGANLASGFAGATHPIIIFADADGSYNFAESHTLVSKLEEGHDIVIGSRYKGSIAAGAMPFLHRYLGTPVLNFFINMLYGRWGNRISDCNSGFRCFYKETLQKLSLRSAGMEFASEMLVKSLRHKLSIAEVPISLVPDGRDRAAYLHTWRDGMRHLLQIFASAPHFFFWVGTAIWSIAILVMGFSYLTQPIAIGGIKMFGIHTTLIAYAGMLIGLQIWDVGVLISTTQAYSPVSKMYHRLTSIAEEKLFILLCVFILSLLAGIGWVFLQWASHNFQLLAIEKEIVLVSSFLITFFNIIITLIAIRLVQRSM